MKSRTFAVAACALALVTLLGTAARAQEVGETETIDRGQIRFARGASSTVVRGNLRRGVRDQYLIRARPGQVMTVRFESADPLMGFDLYVTEGLGAEPVTEADKLQREWSGRLPRGDEYYLNVMTAGRGAAYSFEISIGSARTASPARPAASTTPLPAPEFRAELAKVKRQTRVRVLLPDALPDALDRPLYVTASGIADSYGFSLALTRRCGGAGACTVGNFEGSRGGTVAEELEAVQLANGITGRYKPLTCGASCSAPSVEWQDYPFFYSIQLKLNYGDEARDKAALIALANSAIKAGPR
ncbi:MAG TPA: hypothetical protein VEY09_04805 [Pyrinomonadaceae bacterium]|nr:hypothetical protein [Pyrinomonadaceae bacterium]